MGAQILVSVEESFDESIIFKFGLSSFSIFKKYDSEY